MVFMPSPIVSNTTRFHRLLAPAFIGSAYALIKFWTLYSFGLLEKNQIDFFMLFLGGLMIGVSVRPFFQKVYWQQRRKRMSESPTEERERERESYSMY